MAQKHLHELLREDQEPFQLKNYIADKHLQLKKNHPTSSSSSQTIKKRNLVTQTSKLTKNNNTTTLLCKHACFFPFQDSPDVRKSPLPTFTSPKKPKTLLHVPAATSTMLLEAAMRIHQKQKSSKKLGLFGSILRKMKRKKLVESSRIGNIDKMELETSSSCRFEDDDERIFELGDNNESRPMSPFRFNLQKCPSMGRRTPEFSSSATSPARFSSEDKSNYESIGLANIEQEEEEKEQSSPVSVLDPPFDDDDGHEEEDEEEDEEDDGYDLECNYALVQRAQQQLLNKLRRFERLAELDPIELEKLMLEEESNDDLEERDEFHNDDEEESVLSFGERDHDTVTTSDMEMLVSDLISEEKFGTKFLNNREVVIGRVCKRLDSWQYVRSDTIDMMVGLDLKNEFDDWKKFQEQREEIAMEVEVSIFRLLVEELAEELVHLVGH